MASIRAFCITSAVSASPASTASPSAVAATRPLVRLLFETCDAALPPVAPAAAAAAAPPAASTAAASAAGPLSVRAAIAPRRAVSVKCPSTSSKASEELPRDTNSAPLAMLSTRRPAGESRSGWAWPESRRRSSNRPLWLVAQRKSEEKSEAGKRERQDVGSRQVGVSAGRRAGGGRARGRGGGAAGMLAEERTFFFSSQHRMDGEHLETHPEISRSTATCNAVAMRLPLRQRPDCCSFSDACSGVGPLSASACSSPPLLVATAR